MRIALIFFCIVCFLSCEPSNDQQGTSSISDSTIKVTVKEYDFKTQRIDELLAQQKDSIIDLIDRFTPKEVYFEIVRRQMKTSTDTLPPDITLNYTTEEIVSIRRKVLPLLSLSNVQLLSLYNEVNEGHKVIYGADDRLPVIYDTNNIQNVSDTANPFMVDARSVVAIIPKTNMSLTSSHDYVLHPEGTLRTVFRLCETERFLDDPVVANCSGYAATTDKIVTAGHCINKSSMKGFYFVFDFMIDRNGRYATRIAASKVFQATEFIGGLVNDREDFAVIRVDRPIDPMRVAAIDSTNLVNEDDRFHVIGCPCGTPMKLASNANTRSFSNPEYFTITSDTYGGNSGSPVFNSESHKVCGILVRGEKDFRSFPLNDAVCNVSVVCPFDGCRGEDVSRNRQYLSLLSK
jgi:Trypsin-like peptidase domain